MTQARPQNFNNEVEGAFLANKIDALIASNPESPLAKEYLEACQFFAELRELEQEEFDSLVMQTRAQRQLEDDEYYARLLEEAKEAMRRAFAINKRLPRLPEFDVPEKAQFKSEWSFKVHQLAACNDELRELDKLINKVEEIQTTALDDMRRLHRAYTQDLVNNLDKNPLSFSSNGCDFSLDVQQHEDYKQFVDTVKNRPLTTQEKEDRLTKNDSQHPVLVRRREEREKAKQIHIENGLDDIRAEQLAAEDTDRMVKLLDNIHLNNLVLVTMIRSLFKKKYGSLENYPELRGNAFTVLIEKAIAQLDGGRAAYINNMQGLDRLLQNMGILHPRLVQQRENFVAHTGIVEVVESIIEENLKRQPRPQPKATKKLEVEEESVKQPGAFSVSYQNPLDAYIIHPRAKAEVNIVYQENVEPYHARVARNAKENVALAKEKENSILIKINNEARSDQKQQQEQQTLRDLSNTPSPLK